MDYGKRKQQGHLPLDHRCKNPAWSINKSNPSINKSRVLYHRKLCFFQECSTGWTSKVGHHCFLAVSTGHTHTQLAACLPTWFGGPSLLPWMEFRLQHEMFTCPTRLGLHVCLRQMEGPSAVTLSRWASPLSSSRLSGRESSGHYNNGPKLVMETSGRWLWALGRTHPVAKKEKEKKNTEAHFTKPLEEIPPRAYSFMTLENI